MEVSSKVQQAYTGQYDDSSSQWRMNGAKFKAQNIVELSKNIAFDSVLEVGCGEGSILYWLSQWNFSKNLYGIEISSSGVEIVKSKDIANLKEVLLFDGYKIPYKDNQFDLIVCSHVLEHVEHERILLREIKRVSRYQIFEVPIDFSFYVDKKIKHFLSYGHINIYTPSLFRFLLRSENFTVLADKPYMYPDEVLAPVYSKNSLKYFQVKVKQFILKQVPYLMGIKPNAYVVLTESTDQGITIFDPNS